MLLFIVGDVEEIVIVGRSEASVDEGLFWHGADGALVEDILEMLKG